MTPKQRHREAAFTHWNGLLVCGFADEPEHACGGRLQAEHPIEAQRLTTLYNRCLYAIEHGRPAPAYAGTLLSVPLDDLIADGRNSAWICEIGHRQKETQRFRYRRLEGVEEFARDYGIEHEIPKWRESPTNNRRD